MPKIDKKQIADEISHLLISNDEFREKVMDEVEFNAQLLRDGENFILPRLVVHSKKTTTSDWEAYIVGFADMPELEDRQEAFKAIGAKIAKDTKANPLCVTFCSEAWIKGLTKEEEAKRTKAVSEYEDKKSCILVAGMTIDKRQEAAVLMIDRDEDNKIIPHEIQFMQGGQENNLLRAFYYGYMVEAQK